MRDIENFKSTILPIGEEPLGVYIEKSTGLSIRILGGTTYTTNDATNTIIDFDYNFNNVNDSDLKIPDAEQYRLQK